MHNILIREHNLSRRICWGVETSSVTLKLRSMSRIWVHDLEPKRNSLSSLLLGLCCCTLKSIFWGPQWLPEGSTAQQKKIDRIPNPSPHPDSVTGQRPTPLVQPPGSWKSLQLEWLLRSDADARCAWVIIRAFSRPVPSWCFNSLYWVMFQISLLGQAEREQNAKQRKREREREIERHERHERNERNREREIHIDI